MSMKNKPARQGKIQRLERENSFIKGLIAHFEKSQSSTFEKLQNFSKYVPRQSLALFLAKYELFKKVLDVQGSIIEGGVYLGGGLMTFAQMSAILEPMNYQRKIVGFDTFEGFPLLSQKDRKSESAHAHTGGLSIPHWQYEELLEITRLYDENRFIGHIPKVELVKGDVKKTLPQYLKDNPQTVVSLLYLDFDIYEPTKFTLGCLIPRMPKGAIIAFDELNSSDWPGETLAVLESVGIKNLRIQRFPFVPALSYATLL